MRLQGVEGILYKDRKKRELARLVKIEMMGYDCVYGKTQTMAGFVNG